jgi:alginate O-acetyltransferase complex protein AlgI
MPFHSATLLLLVFALTLLYWASPWQGVRLFLLLAASLTIYAWRHPPSLLLLLGSIAFNYVWGRVLEARPTRPLLALGVALNLSSLLYFKYATFLGLSHASPWLPLGISFFTFQVIAYLVDVYRRELPAERSLLVFAVFKSFFAQLIAGPIVRGKDLLPQLRTRRTLDWNLLHNGLLLVVAGLFLKVGVADLLAQHVDHAWKNLDTLAANEAAFAVYGYAAQLLADFCGYSTMAVGFGLLFGLRLPPNFAHPYGADSLREFWRRWHITLSHWLRDYLYIPLGGNQRHAELNRLVTMTLGGLWHGAAWTFVAWGFLHGALMWLERRIAFLPRALRVLITFHAVALLWVLFRAPSFAAAGQLFARLASFTWKTNVPTQFLVVTFGFLAAQRWWFTAFPLEPRPQPLTARWELPLAAGMIIWLLGYGSARLDFIYFVF